jgi:hypothetical protein
MLHATSKVTSAAVAALPSLTINDLGRAYLHTALVAQLGIQHGQPADLVPPPTDSPYWHLDLRPEAERHVNCNGQQRFRINDVRLPFSLLNPDDGPLTLYLLPGEPAQPGYYPLLPAEAFEQAYVAFLEQAAINARQATAPS